MLPPGAIIPLDDDHANIPADWSRVTAWDGKYIKITTSDWGNTGGNATHSHTSPSHTHTYTNNGHTHTTGTISGNVSSSGTGQHKDAPDYDVVTQAHSHNSVTSGAMTGASITSATVAVTAVNNEYSKYDVIFITSSKYKMFPQNSLIIRGDTSSRQNATHFDTLDSRYMKGAAAGQDSGNATTVSNHNHPTTHTHTLTHGHSSVNSGSVLSGKLGSDNTSSAMRDHSHTVYFTDHNEDVTNNDNTASATSDLAYQEVHFWKATQETLVKVGDIVFWTGSDLPVGWSDMGYNDIYVKGKAEGQSLSSGGSNTHTHSDLTHSHIGSSHTHPWYTSTASNTGLYRNGGTPMAAAHSHIGTTSAATNQSTGTTSATFSTDNHEPEYVKARMIQATAAALGVGAGGVVVKNFIK